MNEIDLPSNLVTFTGVPAVGKTSLIEAAMALCEKKGVTPVLKGDYLFLKSWAQEHRGQEHLVIYPIGAPIDSDDFMLAEEAYGEASSVVIPALAQAIKAEVGPRKAFFTEAAMGAGKPRTSYGEHYFYPLAAVLKGLVSLANAEIVIPNTEILMTRARKRYEDTNHQAPPPEVTARYLLNDRAQSSLAFAENSGFNVIFNEKIDNSLGPIDALAQVEAMMAIVLSQ